MFNYFLKIYVVLICLLTSVELVEGASFEFLKEKDVSGTELRHLIGIHFAKRFVVEDGTASCQIGRNGAWVDYEIQDFELKPMVQENSFTKKADDLNGITLRVSVTVSGSAYRKKEGRTWEEWKPGNLALLAWAHIKIVKRNGVFELSENVGADQIRVKDVRPDRGIRRE